MNPLWDFWYGLPNRRYLEFVGHFIIQVQGGGDVDPFGVDLPDEFADATYVRRERVTDEIRRPSSRIVLGEAGIGKSAIFASLLRWAGESILSVGPHLRQVGATLPEPGILAGKASLLTLDLLAPHVFETYWEETICSRRAKYLRRLRADRQWMELLRWFYRRYLTNHPKVDDHELMAWLQAPTQAKPLHPQISQLHTIRELIRLITWNVSPDLFFGSREFLQAYTKVQVLLDGTEQLSPPAVRRLVTDAQNLYDLHLDGFQFKLFIDSTWEERVAKMDCVRQNRVNVVNVPRWSKSELRELLRRRILAFQSGGSTSSPKDLPEYDLGNLLADSGTLRSEARNSLESLLINGAQGIPLHALCLARCVVAACAGCWPEEFRPPLMAYDINRLVALYHENVRLSRNGSELAPNRPHKE